MKVLILISVLFGLSSLATAQETPPGDSQIIGTWKSVEPNGKEQLLAVTRDKFKRLKVVGCKVAQDIQLHDIPVAVCDLFSSGSRHINYKESSNTYSIVNEGLQHFKVEGDLLKRVGPFNLFEQSWQKTSNEYEFVFLSNR